MNCWPLATVPKPDYHPSRSHRRWFGADRDHGRKHAACDLLAPLGTEVYAVADGFVDEVIVNFYNHTSAIAIRHTSGLAQGCVVRYCELLRTSVEWTRGKRRVRVVAGQVIGQVGRMLRDSMLHFELYGAGAKEPYTVKSNRPYQRHADLMNPTALLDKLKNFPRMSFPSVKIPDEVAMSIK